MAGFLYWKPVVSLKLNLINILSSQPVAGLIRAMLKNKIPHCGRIIYTNNPIITNKVVGHIFFKTYESSEVRFVREFLRTDLPTIELGCSLGVVAMQIAAKTKQHALDEGFPSSYQCRKQLLPWNIAAFPRSAVIGVKRYFLTASCGMHLNSRRL